MNGYATYTPSFENASSAREIELENRIISPEFQLFQEDYSRMFNHLPLKSILASNYLSSAEPYLAQLVSQDSLKKILSTARYFPGNLTSFLGFECRLTDSTSQADWAFAISGKGNDRQVFTNLIGNGNFPKQYLKQPEWQHIAGFAKAWIDPNSSIYDKIQSFWLEFDMPDELPNVLIPSVFFGPEKNSNHGEFNDASEFPRLISNTLSLLKGTSLSQSLETQVIKCILRLPPNAALQFAGVMLSRSSNGIRLYINKLYPKQIVPYLNSIGWVDIKGKLSELISEIEDKADRFVIGFDVEAKGIGPKIGIECSYKSNKFYQETRWSELLDYLVKKNICLPGKREALLHYSGTEDIEKFSGGVMKPLNSVSIHLDELLSSVIVRYISHIKIVYESDQPLEAKAYPAVRLFEHFKNVFL